MADVILALGRTEEQLFPVEIMVRERSKIRLFMTADEILGVREAWTAYHRDPQKVGGDWGMPPYLELINYAADGSGMTTVLLRYDVVDALELPILVEL